MIVLIKINCFLLLLVSRVADFLREIESLGNIRRLGVFIFRTTFTFDFICHYESMENVTSPHKNGVTH